MRRDGNFDLIGDAFEVDIYGSSKGAVRMAVLWDDLLAAIPRLRNGGLDILDAGGGAGHLAIRLAQLGHRVVLADPHATCVTARKPRRCQKHAGSVCRGRRATQNVPSAWCPAR